MKPGIFVGLLLVFVVVVSASAAPTQSPPLGTGALAADAAFQQGHFAAAQAAYDRIATQDPKNFRAETRLGYLALLGNRLEEAQRPLEAAHALDPASRVPTALLAEVYSRRDDFPHAASLMRAIGAAAQAEQMESFAGQRPYEITPPQKAVTVKFVVTDPLPVVQVRVNGSAPVNFLIDTGGSELTLDPDFSKDVGARQFGLEVGTFAGGKQAPFQYGRVESVTLGGMEVKNVPVLILPVHPLSALFGGLRLDGIVGTVFLSHFLATLDYPQGRLVLEPRAETRQFPREAKVPGALTIPFWMAGDHFMVAHGTLNGGKERLFLVDTGLADGGFSAPEATLTEAGIALDRAQAGTGIGGGGAVQVIPFDVDTLTLGGATQRHVQGLFSGPFPFEDTFGFHLSGLISHGFFRSYALTLDFTHMQYSLRSFHAR